MLYHNKPVATLYEHGIVIDGFEMIPWHGIEKAIISSVKGQEFVEIRLKDFLSYKNRLSWRKKILVALNSLVGDYHVTLPQRLTMSNQEILKEISDRL